MQLLQLYFGNWSNYKSSRFFIFDCPRPTFWLYPLVVQVPGLQHFLRTLIYSNVSLSVDSYAAMVQNLSILTTIDSQRRLVGPASRGWFFWPVLETWCTTNGKPCWVLYHCKNDQKLNAKYLSNFCCIKWLLHMAYPAIPVYTRGALQSVQERHAR